MADRIYRVSWSTRHQKYAARCLGLPSLAALGTTPQRALDQIVQLVADSGSASPVSEVAPDDTGQGGPIGISAPIPRPAAALVPRWRTRC